MNDNVSVFCVGTLEVRPSSILQIVSSSLAIISTQLLGVPVSMETVLVPPATAQVANLSLLNGLHRPHL